MDNELNAMTGSGGTIELGGEHYLISRPTVADFSDYLAWLNQEVRRRHDPLEQIKPALVGLPPEAAQRLIELAYHDSQEFRRKPVDLDSTEAKEVQQSLDGVAFEAWLSIRHRHPELTLKRVRDLIAGQEIDIEVVKQKLREIAESSGDGPKNRPARETTNQPIPSPGKKPSVTSP